MRRRRSGYGQKGGIGPTAGRTAATYEVTFPDGTTARKRSYFVDADDAQYAKFLGIAQAMAESEIMHAEIHITEQRQRFDRWKPAA